MSYPQLTGSVSSTADRAGSTAIWFAVLMLAAVLAVAGWQYWPRPAPPPPVATAPVAPSVPTQPAIVLPDDTQLRLAHADAELVQAAEQLSTARRQLAALGPDLGRSYLSFEQRRAETAWTACEAAARAIEQARADVKLVKSTDKE
jgi:hypothetical protein